MQVRGTVVSVDIDVQVAKNGGGSYPGSRLSYRDDTGALKEQCFHNNAFKFNAPLKVQLSNLTVGQSIIMDKEKKGDFWNVLSITPEDKMPGASNSTGTAPSKTTASPKSTYETPEERAKKQVYIVRQSSLANAIALLASNGGKKNTTEEAIETAKKFEAFVFGEEYDNGSLETMPSDTDEIY